MTRTVYNFKNTCSNCFNDVEFPLLGDFAYGVTVFQTIDGKEFYFATLIDNPAFDFIITILEKCGVNDKWAQKAQRVLALVADKPNEVALSEYYPLCPTCLYILHSYNDNIRTSISEIASATWTEFNSLTDEHKTARIQEALSRKA